MVGVQQVAEIVSSALNFYFLCVVHPLAKRTVVLANRLKKTDDRVVEAMSISDILLSPVGFKPLRLCRRGDSPSCGSSSGSDYCYRDRGDCRDPTHRDHPPVSLVGAKRDRKREAN